MRFPIAAGMARRDEAGPWSLDAVAAEVRTVADRLGWARFHVIGHSMGGKVAQRLLIDLPGRVASVVLLAPVPASGVRLDAARRALLRRAIAETEARRDLIDANTGRTRPADWIERVLQLSLCSTRPEALADYLESWSGWDFSRDVRAVEVPVQIIVGDLDPTAPLNRMQETILRWYPHATLHRLPGVGHYPMIEVPDALCRLISGHLDAADHPGPAAAP
jgi:pimeloyl-ACP methyl ester carboxylesterase